MMLFVWQGENVLKDYGTGVVVVAAPDRDTAWARLKESDPQAWAKLTYNQFPFNLSERYTLAVWEAELADDEREAAIRDGFPVQPVVYSLDSLPVIVKFGGE